MTDQTAALLDRHHIPHAAPVDVDLASIDLELSIAHQVRGQDVDHGHVARLAEGYERGDTFPPLIIRDIDGRTALVGGMHRTHAALAAQVKSHAAYLVDVDDHTARLLAVDDNARHGLPLTKAEARHQAVLLVDGGSTIKAAATAVGIAHSTVADEVAIARARTRADDVGCALAFDQVAARARKTAVAIAGIEDDACFYATAQTVAASRPQFGTVANLVERLSRIPDQAERLAEIGDLEDEVTPRRAGGAGRSGGYDVHAGDDSAIVQLTDALVKLLDVDVDRAVAGIRGKDGETRTERRIQEAGRQLIALGRALDRRRGRAA